MGKTLVFHSYKGGTGKTTIAANVAAIFARQGKKVCILDFDFRAPSLYFLFKTKPRSGHWLNDFLNGRCDIANVLQSVSIDKETQVSVGLADPSSDAMWESTRKDRDWWADAFRKLLDAKSVVYRDLGFDYMIIDTSPGIQDSSMNALAASDLVLLVLKYDELDVKGTREMVENFSRKLGRQTAMILNRVLFKPLEQATLKQEKELARKVEEEFGFPVLGTVPCFCDVLIGGSQILYSVEQTDHPFSKNLLSVANSIAAKTL